MKVILDAEVRLDLRGFDGNTAYDLAIANGYTEMAALIRAKMQAA